MERSYAEWIGHQLIEAHVPDSFVGFLTLFILIVGLAISVAIVVYVTRKIFLSTIERITAKTKTQLDDILVKNRFFSSLAHLLPAMIINASEELIFNDIPGLDSSGHDTVSTLEQTLYDLVNIYVIIVMIRLINALLLSVVEYMQTFPLFKDKPLMSYVQLGKLVNYLIGGILIISVIINKDPIYLFGAMGAMTAVLLLIFKDTILGFVASIQLASNDMVRIGDWISMERYGADGDVFEINLTTIKVRNFDKTITTIPTYSFISDSFKNWRGMMDSDGRRVKRAINFKVGSIHYCSEELISRLKRINLLKDYLEDRLKVIEEANAANPTNQDHLINGRRLTNVGVFRVYMELYLKQQEGINQKMTLMVRQLALTENGLPLEMYCFSKSKEWAVYEGVMADIMDHLLSAASEFELEVFQNPAGSDLKYIQLNGPSAKTL